MLPIEVTLRLMKVAFLLAVGVSVMAPFVCSEQEVSLAKTKAAFQVADRALNEAYQKAKSSMTEFRFLDLQYRQKQWLEFRNHRSRASAVFAGGAKEGEEQSNRQYWSAAKTITEDRTTIINALINPEGISNKKWEGIWIDGKGGRLRIHEEVEGTIMFFAESVRGPSHHSGSIAGRAKTNGSLARFTDSTTSEDEEIWLNFFHDGYSLQVIGANTFYYHRARGYFNGNYVRISTVDSKILKKEVEEFISSE